MFSSKANYLKLRTNLRLCINRLKLLQKKKTELALKARREISEYIGAGKEDRARIRVEHIIREDYLVEAFEIIEMLCDLLLARFGLIEKMNEIDPGLEEAITTIIWVAPRLCAEVQELKEVAHQLTIKYGKEYADMCRRNGFETVNEQVVHKMSAAAPPKILVENYMIEIARTYKVPFEPDPLVMMDRPPETADLIELGTDVLPAAGNSSDNKGGGGGDGGFGSGGGFGASGGSGGGGLHITSPSPGAGYSKQHEAGWAVPGGSGMPSAGAAGIPLGGPGGSGSWHCSPSGAVSSAGGPGVDGGMQYGATCPGMGGNVNYVSVPGGTSGFSADLGMPPSYSSDVNAGVDAAVGGNAAAARHGDVSAWAANMNIASTAGTGVAGGGCGLPDDHNPLAGGVPVLPDSDGTFPEPFHSVPDSTVRQTPGSFTDASSLRVPPPLPSHRPNAGSPVHPVPPANFPPPNTVGQPFLPPYDEVVQHPDRPLPYSQSAVPGLSTVPSYPVPDFPVLPDIPGLPSVPTNSVGRTSVTSNDVDFDDLARRFEELKKRK